MREYMQVVVVVVVVVAKPMYQVQHLTQLVMMITLSNMQSQIEALVKDAKRKLIR